MTSPTRLLPSLILLVSTTLVSCNPLSSSQGCPPCDPDFCPNSADACVQGMLPDPCKCCELGVCVLSEGERCLHNHEAGNFSFTDLRMYGACRGNLVCLPRTDLMPEDEAESICTCKNSTPMCGMTNTTYDTVCHLEEAGDTLRTEGPCVGVPEIVSSPLEVTVPEARELMLDCEVKGFPVPTVFWEFQALDGSMVVLPGDDSAISVQSRGGPETYMTTSWVQIYGARPSDAGSYFCVASNSEGETRAIATVSVLPTTSANVY